MSSTVLLLAYDLHVGSLVGRVGVEVYIGYLIATVFRGTRVDAGPSGSGLIDSEDAAELEALGRDSSDMNFEPVKGEVRGLLTALW